MLVQFIKTKEKIENVLIKFPDLCFCQYSIGCLHSQELKCNEISMINHTCTDIKYKTLRTEMYILKCAVL